MINMYVCVLSLLPSPPRVGQTRHALCLPSIERHYEPMLSRALQFHRFIRRWWVSWLLRGLIRLCSGNINEGRRSFLLAFDFGFDDTCWFAGCTHRSYLEPNYHKDNTAAAESYIWYIKNYGTLLCRYNTLIPTSSIL